MPTPVSTTGQAPDPASQRTNPKGILDKDDFLKLFVAQMQKQDPSAPMDNAQMMAQMASFSSVEQMANLTKINEGVAATLGQTNAISLIGRTVTYLDGAGAEHTGAVEKVTTAGGKTVLTVGGVDGIDPGTVTQVS